MSETPEFYVIPGPAVTSVLDGNEVEVMRIIEKAYKSHGNNRTINPPSHFLTFPDRPRSRIIALPASVSDDRPVDGIKWISSFPDNLALGLPRASALLILNDQRTGFPFSCLEGSIISATRTAASAALAATSLFEGKERPHSVTYFGAGLIAKYVHRYLVRTGWTFNRVTIFDHDTEYAAQFAEYVHGLGGEQQVVERAGDPDSAIRASGLIIFATTAAEPHVTNLDLFSHRPTVLNLSLRDLSPDIILGSANILDDIEHCLRANTSPHLAEQQSGSRDFVDGTLPEVLSGAVKVPDNRPVVFSPFGLGVLDLALGAHVHQEAIRHGDAIRIPDFFSDLSRYS